MYYKFRRVKTEFPKNLYFTISEKQIETVLNSKFCSQAEMYYNKKSLGKTQFILVLIAVIIRKQIIIDK